jgi:NADH-quinone oxidoreductase subunit J
LGAKGGQGADWVAEQGGNIHAVGRLLFRDYLLPFEVTSVLLLVAVVGVIVLAKKEIR